MPAVSVHALNMGLLQKQKSVSSCEKTAYIYSKKAYSGVVICGTLKVGRPGKGHNLMILKLGII